MTRISRERESYVPTQELTPTRRLFLGAGSAAAVFGAVGAAAHSCPDAELIRLGHEFKAAWATEKAGFSREVSDATATELIKPCTDLARRIEGIPAKTLHGLMVKAEVVNWCHCADFDGFEDTTDLRVAAGIIRDLLALAV
jgi:hypothetical protein